MLQIDGLNQSYSGSHILRDVSLEVPAGSVTGLLGRNGVGKTTLLNCILGLLPIESGVVRLNGHDISGLTTEQRVAAGIAIVPQGRMILPRLTVEENLQLALASRRDGVRRVPDEVFAMFPVLHEMRRRLGGDLSGGQQQQLAIGRALVQGPKLLLLDEPCEGIQPSIVQDIAARIRDFNERLGMTILVVDQNLQFVRSISERYFIMQRGTMVASGPIGTLDDATIDEYLKV